MVYIHTKKEHELLKDTFTTQKYKQTAYTCVNTHREHLQNER